MEIRQYKREVVLGGGIFPIESKSTLRKAFVGNRGKNKVDLPLEEHVFIEEEAVDDDELFTNEELREVGVIESDNEF